MQDCPKLVFISCHRHVEELLFAEVMLSESWNMSKLKQLVLVGVGPRTVDGGLVKARAL
ncbi:hypothetical protein BGX29_009870, partial [Mortierella sp. GBA35]